jgi:hypothetical protein
MTYILRKKKTMNTTTPNSTTRPSFWLRAIEQRKHRLTREYRTGLGDAARDGVSDEDYATTMATLERMARNLGWTEDEHTDHHRGFGRRHFGPEHGRGHGYGHGRGFGHGRGHDQDHEQDQDHFHPENPGA